MLRTELEEMVASSPCGKIFIAPTVTCDGCSWSFLVHERDEVIRSIEALSDGSGRLDGRSEVSFVLIPAIADGARLLIPAFLFRFETEPPVVYFVFINAQESYASELLADIALQDELAIEFFEERRVISMALENTLKDTIEDAMAALRETTPYSRDTFDLVVYELLSREPDPLAMWELLISVQTVNGREA